MTFIILIAIFIVISTSAGIIEKRLKIIVDQNERMIDILEDIREKD